MWLPCAVASAQVFRPAQNVAESAMAGSTNMACMPHVVRLAKAHEGTVRSEMLSSIWRPADVLTSAVSASRVSALEVGIAAVEALNAGVDCTESMRLRKRQAYSRHLPALEAEGIEYRPLVWSCWGREHLDTTAVLTMLARQAARRRGLPSHKPLLQKTRAQFGAALARRSAAAGMHAGGVSVF